VRVAADHDIDGLVEFSDDIHDRPGNAGAFVVVAGRKSALMDQHNDGLNTSRLQLWHQRVHGFGLVAEFETGHGLRGDDAGRPLQRQSDERDRDALEIPDLVGREDGFTRGFFEGAGRQIMKRGAGKRVRPLAFIDGMATAVLLKT